jgi:hypothetical protein
MGEKLGLAVVAVPYSRAKYYENKEEEIEWRSDERAYYANMFEQGE